MAIPSTPYVNACSFLFFPWRSFGSVPAAIAYLVTFGSSILTPFLARDGMDIWYATNAPALSLPAHHVSLPPHSPRVMHIRTRPSSQNTHPHSMGTRAPRFLPLLNNRSLDPRSILACLRLTDDQRLPLSHPLFGVCRRAAAIVIGGRSCYCLLLSNRCCDCPSVRPIARCGARLILAAAQLLQHHLSGGRGERERCVVGPNKNRLIRQ